MIPMDILYNRLASPSLLPWLESIDLVERRAGRASTLSITLCNADGRFLGQWRATRGDSLAVSMPPAAPDVYAIKKISFKRAPLLVTWEAEGRPATTKAPSGRGKGAPPPSSGAIVEEKKSWPEPVEGKRLKDIAQRVCAECGLALKYVARSNPVVKYVARYNETGFHLITRLCRMFALTMRATAGDVTILAMRAKQDTKPPASVPVQASDIIALSAASGVKPKSVRSARLDPRSAKPVRHAAGDGDGVDIDLPYDADAAEDLYAAEVAAVDSATVEIIPRAGIVAGSIVDLQGVGLREVMEMRYTRTGDAERMTLTVRPI